MKKYVADELSEFKFEESKPPVIVNLNGWTAKATWVESCSYRCLDDFMVFVTQA